MHAVSYAVVAYDTNVYRGTTDPLHEGERDVLRVDRSVDRLHFIQDLNGIVGRVLIVSMFVCNRSSIALAKNAHVSFVTLTNDTERRKDRCRSSQSWQKVTHARVP